MPRAIERVMRLSRRSFIAFVIAALPFAGCSSPLYLATPPSGMATGERSTDPLLATRASGALDLSCPERAIEVYRIEESRSRQRTTYLDVAEGCGRRATYAENCGLLHLPPPGTTIAEAKRSGEWTVDDPRDETYVCELTLIGRVSLR